MDGEFDPRDEEHGKRVLGTADLLLNDCSELGPLNTLEQQLFRRHEDVPLPVHLAVKLARSKALVRTLNNPLHVSFVAAVYKEHTRMLRPDQHPHGEDCLVKKIEQLRWLFDDTTPVTWRIFIVDDGCPEHSGRLAQEILADRCPDAPTRVLFLEEAINMRAPHYASNEIDRR